MSDTHASQEFLTNRNKPQHKFLQELLIIVQIFPGVLEEWIHEKEVSKRRAIHEINYMGQCIEECTVYGTACVKSWY